MVREGRMGLFDKFKEVTKKVSEVENNIYNEKRDYLEIYERNIELEKEIAERCKQTYVYTATYLGNDEFFNSIRKCFGSDCE